ncbi:predicted protein [Plenodomus lingam JN3]|uniref:Predicted protein n=1 Tax=Leptosphaeria maculans (strain JN3 / isolate v23.1.3 / race Av1-4-5-6-7-8) TaxID=985895 RepID=E4ZT10_LEPMJ|nr:predicted protein [Plenodomus lingam JN3]CBX94598.1 predicted protein [Plenodomus lingam JN3]
MDSASFKTSSENEKGPSHKKTVAYAPEDRPRPYTRRTIRDDNLDLHET